MSIGVGYKGLGQGGRARRKMAKRKRPLPNFTPSISLFTAPRRSIEYKQVDVPKASYPLNTTGAVTLINGLDPGNFPYQFLGRKITLKSVALDWCLTFVRAIGNIDQGRVAIIYDKQPNGILPAIADIFQDIDSTGATSTSAMSGMNLNNGDRFRVICDRRLCLPLINDTATTAIAFPSDKNDLAGNVFRKMSMDTTFNLNGDSTILSIDTGALYLVTFGDTTAGSEGFSLTAKTRVRFTDA